MPCVIAEVPADAGRDVERRVAERVAAALGGEMGRSPEHVRVVIQEIAEEDRGRAGMPTDEWRTRAG